MTVKQKRSELAHKIERWIDRTNKSTRELTEKEFNQFLYLCEQLDKLGTK